MKYKTCKVAVQKDFPRALRYLLNIGCLMSVVDLMHNMKALRLRDDKSGNSIFAHQLAMANTAESASLDSLPGKERGQVKEVY
jgi:hypothetical protein